jgi:hypothetical protein
VRWLGAALLLVPVMAFAQVDRSPEQRIQRMDFDPEKIDGTPMQAELERVDTRPSASFSNLIRVRKDFRDKIRESSLP